MYNLTRGLLLLPQVALCWSNVSSLHVDDFVGCGTDQMLLVFRSQSAPVGSVDNFLITDLCGTSYSHGQESSEGPNASDTAPENYLLTVQALQSRLQSGLTVLQDLQRDVSVKERVLRQSLQSLADMVSGREHILTQTEQESLVSLWDEDEEEAVDTNNQIVTGIRPPPVEKLWHRFIEERLVVGVILTAECVDSVESVTLSILTEGGQSRVPVVIETQSRGSWFTPPRPSSHPSHPEPAAKRGRQDGAGGDSDTVTQKLAVTAVTDLTPLLTSGSVRFPVMLHYTQRQESSGSTTAPGPAVVQCGQVRVDIQAKPRPQLLDDSRLTTGEAVEDLLSLLAVLETWTFLIYSPGHTLCDVAGWIQRSVPCERLEINPRYLLTNPAGPSAAMLFNWEQTTPFQGKLSVHCSQFQLLRFLDSLCVFLPASCSVLPLRNSGGKGTSPRLALSLEKEVLSLKQGVSSLLCGEEVGGEGRKSNGGRVTDPPDPSSADGLRGCREEWERSTLRSRSSLRPLVDVERYRRLTRSLAQARLQGDLAALLKTHLPGATL
ncbi:Fanconi anemia group B protein isoform X2 [Esox lucius]|uniref:Fanconi anemia group B protein isoform X2 n=1 Tax=Esox lucius TaxID=8010 RepID=UPI00147691BF|nr:Fanconi anemia group B protein isoform X2 [Esox lucius]